ncbi:SDR family oxidoreductase [Flavobacterium sp. '19STA2R22 D10 B1']|uniref:SDR family oxidoreductase n=1 Tax=Flavobacterium aerium TaxID=3037261 RepID=UPI00278C20F5|nr:SDR family oxidoreductase [Flavobacterium sp. '19STA2R22 D10 B1']
MNLKDAKIIITGGSAGIGYETAKLLKESGAQVVICGRHEDTILKAAQEINVHGFKADVANEADVIALFKFAFEKMGGINALINNAGIGQFSSLVDTTAEDMKKVFDINVLGAFFAGKEAAKYFIKQNHGNIINIASTAARKGFAEGTSYVASKFALAGMTECWRAELRQYNVRVMQVNPSEVITTFGEKLNFPAPTNVERKLKATEIAHVIQSMLSMNDVGFITETSVWATNP